MRRPLIAGNWKMNGDCASSAQLASQLAQEKFSSNIDIAVFPPSLYIQQVKACLQATKIDVGGQSCSTEERVAALTGEVSSFQLKDVGCKFVLVGHSERRIILGETDEQVSNKFIAAVSQGLSPVLCVGETMQEREQDKTFDVIQRQISFIVDAAGIEAFSKSVIAYEPVWAIGTGLSSSPEQAQEVHHMIRQYLLGCDEVIVRDIRIIYGGSVKPTNAADLFSMADIDGGLIGGASLNINEFGAICRAVGN